MKRKRKIQREAEVLALRTFGESKDPVVIKCQAEAKEFGKRITEAKTEAERNQVRSEFNHWAETNPTFKRIVLGAKVLLSL